MVGLQVRPEQLAEQVSQALQRGEVHRGLPLAEVVDQHVPHRGALDAVAVDQLLAAGLPASGEHLDRRRSVLAQAAAGVQELVEQRAPSMPILLTGPGGNAEQFHAVPDLHVTDHAALGSHDHTDPGECLLPSLQPHRRLPPTSG